MNKRIVIPKYFPKLEEVIFLAGPVFQGGAWQNKAIQYILDQHQKIHVAFPDYAGLLDVSFKDQILQSGEKLPHQLTWEQNYLELAEKSGAILFWLPAQKGKMPINSETNHFRTYGRDTRPELGAWGFGNLRHNPKAHVVVGGEEGFDGISVVRRNFERYTPHIHFHTTLEETCDEALKYCS